MFPIFSQYLYSKSKKEGMFSKEKPKVIILLGDSILKNNYYVGYEYSVENLLQQKSNKIIKCYAVNDSKIYDVFSQINRIPIELNENNTYIFISVGGNDILDKYVERKNVDINDFEGLNTFFGNYKKLIKTLKNKMNKCKIIALDLYYPTSSVYVPYKDIIKEWNKKTYEFLIENNIEILPISKIMTNSRDFIFDIEPSKEGGEKIANAINNFSYTF
jgi:hypothetical protein